MESKDKKKIILVCKGDYGIANPGMYKMLKPLNKDKTVIHPITQSRLIQGQEYEFTGDPKLLTVKGGLSNLFEVK